MSATPKTSLAGISGLGSFTREALDRVAKQLRVTFPADYFELLSRRDGAEGVLPKGAYVSFWPLETLLERNNGYRVNDYAPGFVLFGSDGGDMAYAFDSSHSPTTIVALPFIPLDPKETTPLGTSITEFLTAIDR